MITTVEGAQTTLHCCVSDEVVERSGGFDDRQGYDDYLAHKGEQGAKDAGRWRLEGKDYIVADGDVIHFRFNV